MSLIEIKNVSKIYQMGGDPNNTFTALDDISLSIDQGEYVAIIGPSGSGKSTLLQIMGLLDPPTSGSYTFKGQETTRLSDDVLTRFRSDYIGFVFQLFNLLPRTTAKMNTLLPMIYRFGSVDESRAEEVLNQLGMQDHLHHAPSQLSGGQQQRVAIARAMVNQPEVILADEPTGNLPQKQAVEIIQELERLNKEKNITLVIITHSKELAERADRTVRIVDGNIIEDTKKENPTNVASPAAQKEKPRNRSFNTKLWMQTIRMAAQTMLLNKVRTFLTMLGIIIGVFSVVSLLAIGEGAKSGVEYELRRLGSNLFRIKSEWPKIKGSSFQKRTITHIDEKDLKALLKLKDESPLIKDVSAAIEGKRILTYQGYSYKTKVFGVSPSYEFMRQSTPSHGRFFTEMENQNQERVMVIGQTVYKQLFKQNENPLGATIKVDDRSFRVIGLLPSHGVSWGGDVDDVVYIPEQTAMKRVFGEEHYWYFYVQASGPDTLTPAIKKVTQMLRKQHRIGPKMQNDFGIKNYGEMKETVDRISDIMIQLILVVALISLVVGGIGIMNIMLVSVTERTREIGIRKAIGARSRDILGQFLVESIFIGLTGGVIGVVFAFLVGAIMKNMLQWEVIFKPYSIVIAFLFSFSVGIVFGLYPAKKAAKLSPINALRYE